MSFNQYPGPATRAPRGPPGGGGGGAYPPMPQRQYDQYQEDYGYGYEQYDDGYGQNYGPPPQNMYQGPPGPGRGGRPPPPGARGGPMGGPRGGMPQGPGRGFPPQGRGPPPGRSMSVEPGAMRRGPPPMAQPPEQDFGSPFPVFPGQHRKTDLQQENQILDGMAGLDMNGRPGPGPGRRPGPGARRPTNDYPLPPMDDPRGGGAGPYPDPRRGPPPMDQGYGGYQDDGYGLPSRSNTMPANNGHPMQMPPQRADTAPYATPGGRIPPPRPSTASGQRPPPQRMHQGPPPPMPNAYPPAPGWQQEQDRDSLGNFYDAYYDQRASGDHYPPGGPPPEAIPDFDAAPTMHGRSSFDQHVSPPPPQPGMPQPGPARFPEMSRTKSQPNLREPQAAVFEMAPDMPPVPTGGFKAYQPGMPVNSGPGAPGMASGPPAPMRPGAQSTPPHAGPGTGHPAPIRPGHMQNAMPAAVNLNEKPPPVRNYGTPAAAAGAQGRSPQQAMQIGRPPSLAEQTPVSVEELERLRATIRNDPNDQRSALTLSKKLLEAADVLVPRLPDPKSRAKARERYIMDAHKILKKLVSAQNPDAMFFLADCLGRGAMGYEPDNKEAFTLYQSAAKLGHPGAAYRTAVCCELGNDDGGGTRKDPLKAIQWYKRAATLGDTPAMYKVGMILLKGLLGQPRNPREAVGWLKRAAERADAENPHALHELGLLYQAAQPNDPILRDEAYAFQLFEQAAQLGYKFSQFRLGCCFEYGLLGCPIDPRLSIMWYSRAAAQEEHQSELALSGWYLTGSDGVLQQSDTEAYLWARKAAQAGLAKAEYAMGYFTEVGIGTNANMEDAKRWYWRAAAQDFPKARERLEDLKRSGRNAPRQRERISRSNYGKQQEGECSVM
ncbi:hypothetical protein F4780DRAFT_465612 [Xylariomycetidae sp. FL0641]|nr:hypothetical protein F4780DRAFT_465612 [Xylariomycetidae sp. FL0641]